MTENENFLVSIGFTQEEYMGKLWWVDPFFEKDDGYRYLFNDADDAFSVNGKSIEWIMKAIKANISNQARTRVEREVKERVALEVEKALKKVMKSFLK
jgi:hypothetical protein